MIKYPNYRNLILTAGSIDNVAVETFEAVVLVNGQDAALVKVAVLDDFVDGASSAQLGNGQQLGLSVQRLFGHLADVVPGLALAAGAALIIKRRYNQITVNSCTCCNQSLTSIVW